MLLYIMFGVQVLLMMVVMLNGRIIGEDMKNNMCMYMQFVEFIGDDFMIMMWCYIVYNYWANQ